MKGKKGITLVTLIITITILGILVTVGIVGTSQSMYKSKILSFESELKEIEELCQTAIKLNKLESYLDKNEVDISALKSKIAEKDLPFLEEEFIENNENNDSKFRKIDVTKIGANETSKGNQKQGANDAFYISMNTNKVYYLRGMKVKGITYFSLTSKLSLIVINKDIEQKAIELETEEIKVNNFFSETREGNKVKINLKNPLQSNEKLYIQVIDDQGNKYEEEITNLLKNTEYEIKPMRSITNVVLAKAENITFILVKEKTSQEQELSLENTYNIDFVKPIISIENVKVDKNSTNIIINSKEDLTYFYLPTKYIDESNFVREIFKIETKNEDILIEEIIRKGIKTEDKNIRLDTNVHSVLILAIDCAGNPSNVLNLEDIKGSN